MDSISIFNNLCLIPLNELYYEHVYLNLNDKRISETYPIQTPYTRANTDDYFINELQGRNNMERFSFAIEVNNTFSGVCALYDVDIKSSKGKIYYWILPKYWNLGIASNAVKKLISYAKIQLKLSYLETGVLERNHASIRVLVKNGFVVKHILINKGKYHHKFLGEKIVELQLDLIKV